MELKVDLLRLAHSTCQAERIHSMELKVCNGICGTISAYCIAESIQWNWKEIGKELDRITGGGESIQWNWKSGTVSGIRDSPYSSNPFNGIERTSGLVNIIETISYRIHSMELKEHGPQPTHRPQWCWESIQWNWKSWNRLYSTNLVE